MTNSLLDYTTYKQRQIVRKGDAVGDRETETETERREARTQAPMDIHYYEENA